MTKVPYQYMILIIIKTSEGVYVNSLQSSLNFFCHDKTLLKIQHFEKSEKDMCPYIHRHKNLKKKYSQVL